MEFLVPLKNLENDNEGQGEECIFTFTFAKEYIYKMAIGCEKSLLCLKSEKLSDQDRA